MTKLVQSVKIVNVASLMNPGHSLTVDLAGFKANGVAAGSMSGCLLLVGLSSHRHFV